MSPLLSYVIPLWEPPSLPVVGNGGRFPVRRVFCVARNYAAHAREMGGDPSREPPAFFMKPADAIVPEGGSVPYPPATSNLHHEVELVAALGAGGRDIPVPQALDMIYGYAVGLDMTRRDLQAEARKEGKPWDMAKSFDHAAPCGAVVPVAAAGHPLTGAIRLSVNEAVRQQGDLADMIWNVAETISHLSGLVELKPGDLLFTGTPEGVGPVVRGDVLACHIDGVGDLEVVIT